MGLASIAHVRNTLFWIKARCSLSLKTLQGCKTRWWIVMAIHTGRIYRDGGFSFWHSSSKQHDLSIGGGVRGTMNLLPPPLDIPLNAQNSLFLFLFANFRLYTQKETFILFIYLFLIYSQGGSLSPIIVVFHEALLT